MDAILSLLNSIEPWHWAVLGLLLLIGELSTGTTFLLWPAVAAGLVALVAWLMPETGGLAEIGIFAAVTIVLTLMGPRYVRGGWLQGGNTHATLNERGAAMVGQRGIVTEAFIAGLGTVKLGDTTWRAKSDEALVIGDAVEVTAADGPTLSVKRAG
ncbi:MAG: NfeD family protein [Hyphomonadaceae bacterium]